jgi:hypothetical protein
MKVKLELSVLERGAADALIDFNLFVCNVGTALKKLHQ